MSTADAGAKDPKDKGGFLRALTGFSVLGAAIGVWGVIDDLVPNLMRISNLLKWLVSGYEYVRERAYDLVQAAFALIGVAIPEIPPLVKDALMIGALIYAALNFESFRQDKAPLHVLMFRYLIAQFSLDDDEPEIKILNFPDTQITRRIMFTTYFIVNGSLLWLALLGAGIPLPRLALPDVANFAWQAAALGGLVLLFRLGMRWIWGRALHLSWIFKFALELLWVPTHLVLLPIIAICNGWRAVAAAVGLVVLLAGLNYAFAHYLDPMLLHPPSWWTSLTEAPAPPAAEH
jgi:hypothetical protein